MEGSYKTLTASDMKTKSLRGEFRKPGFPYATYYARSDISHFL